MLPERFEILTEYIIENIELYYYILYKQDAFQHFYQDCSIVIMAFWQHGCYD